MAKIYANDIKKTDDDGELKESGANQSVDKADESKEQINTEDNLEMDFLSFSGRMKAKRLRFQKNTEGMSKKEKVKYFLYYYKGKILLALILLFCAIAIPISIYKNTRPVAISYAVVNQDSLSAPGTAGIDGFLKYFNYDNSKYRVNSHLSISLDLETAEEDSMKDVNSNSYTAFPYLCMNGEVDIIITDMTGLAYCTNANLIQPLDLAITQKLYDTLCTEYPDLEIATLKNASDESIECAINISDSEFAKGFNLSYDDVYLCFPGSKDESRTKAKEIIEYIYGVKIEN